MAAARFCRSSGDSPPHETRARPGFAYQCASRAGPTCGGEGLGVRVVVIRGVCPQAHRQPKPNAANASGWCAAASGEKQQNTTRCMPGAPAISAATAPTAMRAARSGGNR